MTFSSVCAALETSLTRSGTDLDCFLRTEMLLQRETEAALVSLMRDVRILPSLWNRGKLNLGWTHLLKALLTQGLGLHQAKHRGLRSWTSERKTSSQYNGLHLGAKLDNPWPSDCMRLLGQLTWCWTSSSQGATEGDLLQMKVCHLPKQRNKAWQLQGTSSGLFWPEFPCLPWSSYVISQASLHIWYLMYCATEPQLQAFKIGLIQASW